MQVLSLCKRTHVPRANRSELYSQSKNVLKQVQNMLRIKQLSLDLAISPVIIRQTVSGFMFSHRDQISGKQPCYGDTMLYIACR